MPSTPSLLNQLSADYPAIRFEPSDGYRWSPDTKTVHYDAANYDEAHLLHELSHGALDHRTYQTDVELLDMERGAWEYATSTLAGRYKITIAEDIVENSLDSYRDWLHDRSTCPTCSATGVQVKTRTYHCIACQATWLVNEARICALRRYTLPSQ